MTIEYLSLCFLLYSLVAFCARNIILLVIIINIESIERTVQDVHSVGEERKREAVESNGHFSKVIRVLLNGFLVIRARRASAVPLSNVTPFYSFARTLNFPLSLKSENNSNKWEKNGVIHIDCLIFICFIIVIKNNFVRFGVGSNRKIHILCDSFVWECEFYGRINKTINQKAKFSNGREDCDYFINN